MGRPEGYDCSVDSVGNGLLSEGKSVQKRRCQILPKREKSFEIKEYFDSLYLAYLLHIKNVHLLS
jgi:hypothetical protein